MTDDAKTQLERYGPPESELDLLITRLLEDETSEADWLLFRELAARSTDAWRKLAEEQHLMRKLSDDVERCSAPALSTPLPGIERVEGEVLAFESKPLTFGGWVRRHSGWAAAIAVAILWLGASWMGDGRDRGNTIDTGNTHAGPNVGGNVIDGNGTPVGNGSVGFPSPFGTSGMMNSDVQEKVVGELTMPDGSLHALILKWKYETAPKVGVDMLYDGAGNPVLVQEPRGRPRQAPM
jgi:hypothetical protein